MISAVQGSLGGASSAKEKDLGKEDFLKLLVTQLKAQDPLNPQDGTEFVAQLAQFTSLERLVNIEDGLGNVAMASMSTNATMASSLIGKTVRSTGNDFSYDGAPTTLHFDLGGEAKTVTVAIKDESGNTVETLTTTGEEGDNSVTWDGNLHDAEGNVTPAPKGKYSFEVDARDADGNPISATTAVLERVTAVHFTSMGIPELVLGSGRRVAMGDVSEIQETPE